MTWFEVPDFSVMLWPVDEFGEGFELYMLDVAGVRTWGWWRGERYYGCVGTVGQA